MFPTIQKCQLDGCNRTASARCFCCNTNICTRHFTEHIDAVKAQIDPLTNEINTMVEKIQGLTVEQITDTSFAELHQWRCNMYQLIDQLFLAKSKEMKDLIETNKNKFVQHKNQQLKTIIKIQDDVKRLVEDGDGTVEQIQLLKNQLTSVEANLTRFEKDFLFVNARVFAQGLVTVSSGLNNPSPPLPPSLPPSQILQSNPTPAQFVYPAQKSRYAPANFGAPTTASVTPNLATPSQPGPLFSMNGFNSILQNNPTTHSSPTIASTFGVVPPRASAPTFVFGNNQARVGNNQPPFGNNQSPFGNNQPPFGNNQSPFGNNQPPFGNNQSPFGNNQSRLGNNLPFNR